jgi:hypothetical protein
LLVDDLGDAYHEPPHVILDCAASQGFFDDVRPVIETDDEWAPRYFFADDAERVQLFPQIIPEVSNEEFDAALRGYNCIKDHQKPPVKPLRLQPVLVNRVKDLRGFGL